MQEANQAAITQATSYQQQYDHLMRHLEVGGQAPDPATVRRILRAKPKASYKGNPPTTRPFSLL